MKLRITRRLAHCHGLICNVGCLHFSGEENQEQYNAAIRALNGIIHRINSEAGMEPIELCKDLLGEKAGKPFFNSHFLVDGWLPKSDLAKAWKKEILNAIERNTVSTIESQL